MGVRGVDGVNRLQTLFPFLVGERQDQHDRRLLHLP